VFTRQRNTSANGLICPIRAEAVTVTAIPTLPADVYARETRVNGHHNHRRAHLHGDREYEEEKMQTLNEKVQDFLAQKRIAVAGVSRDNSRHPVGNLIYHRLKNTGHEVFPVNPHLETFEGDRCYPDVPSIPGGVDGVVVITRPDATERIVRQCSEARVPRVWMHQSFATSQTSVSPKAVEYCHEHDISVIAGACPMMYGPGPDFGHTCMRWMRGLTGGLPK
jgi:predicted CoA-binding protein